MLVAALLLAAAPAAAIDRGALPVFSDPRLADALGPLAPMPGAWAEYAVLPKHGPPARVRVSVLKVEADGRYWLEAVSQTQGLPPIALKLFVRGQPTRVRDVERAFYYLGGQSPIELPLTDAREHAPEDPKASLPRLVHETPRRVRVPGGTFLADVVRVGGARIYREKAVPLWGLVRVESRRMRIDLVGSSPAGATTVFPPGW